MRLMLVWGAVIVLAATGLAGSDAAPEPDFGHEIRVWTTDDGLPHNAVTRALQDARGYLWFGTVGGLARFDGREFRKVSVSAEYPEHAHNIRGLAEESPGTLLVLASPGQLVRVSEGKVEPHPANAHLDRLRDTPVDLYVEPTGAVWLGTAGGSLMRWTGDDEPPAIFGADVPIASRSKRFSFATDTRGITWVAADGFLASFREGSLERHPDAPDGPLLLASGASGRIWVCSEDRLYVLQHHRLETRALDVPWTNDFGSVRHLVELENGDLLVTGRRGILRYRNGTFRSLALRYPLVSYILEDNEGNLWITTSGSGVGQLRERSHRLYNEDSGLRQDRVSALAEGPDGRIWIANRDGGLHVLDPRTGVATPHPRTTHHRPVEVVAVDTRGTVWFGGMSIGLWHFDGSLESTPERVDTPADDINTLLASAAGELWFTTMRGDIARCHDGRIEYLAEDHGPVLGSAYAIVEDRDHSIWVGGRQGVLLRWNGHRFDRIAETSDGAAIHDLLVDRNGRMWVASSSGLYVRESDQLHRISTRHGLPDDLIYNVLEDPRGRLWLATRRGLFHTPTASLVAVVQGEQPHVTPQRLGPEQGLRGFTPTPNYDPNTLRSRDGRLYFATTQGALEIDPSRMPAPATPPPVLLDGLRWNGERRPLPDTGTIRVPSGGHRIDLLLAVLSFTAPESILLQHQLRGFDPGWIQTGSDRVATYTNLEPGRYELVAMARNAAGVWSEPRSLVTLVVDPAWWETGIFRLIAALATTLLVAAIARGVSQRRLRARLRSLEQVHALERERARIARDLHDELGAGITEVGLLADRLGETAPDGFARELSGLAWRTRRLATDLSGIVWTMNSSHSSLDQLAVFLRRYAERLFRHSGVRCVVEGVEQVPGVPVAPDVQHQVLASMKEALNNIVKHARATEARVVLCYSEGVFEVEVRDDGIGYTPARAEEAEGNGLRNMRARMQEVGGTFQSRSDPGRGTVVTFRVPLAVPVERV